jgi:hypothetical protein
MYLTFINIDEEAKLKPITSQPTMRIKARYMDKLVNAMIARIVTSPKLIKDCQTNTLAVQKRRILTARDESRSRVINSRNAGPVFKSHEKVKTQGDKIESEVTTKQFILNNRKLIKTKLVPLLLQK